MSDHPAGGRLEALAVEFWDGFLEANPTFATIIGERHLDARLDDISRTGRRREADRLAATATAARAIDPAELSPEDRLTRGALIDEAGSGLAFLDAGLADFSVDPLEGPQVQLLNLEAFQSIETPERGADLLARWRAMPAFLDTLEDNLRGGLADGRVAVHSPVARTIDQLSTMAAQPLEAWPLMRPIRADRAAWTRAERADFDAELSAIVGDEVAPAFGRFRLMLEAEILPVARPDDDAGLLHLPGGDDAYRSLVRHHTTLDLDPAEVHAIGLREIERTDHDLRELGARVLGTADLAAIQAALRTDPELHFRTSAELVDVAERSVARARTAIPRAFGRLPIADCVVVEMPEHEARHSTVAYYVWPASDGSRPGRYYLNTTDPESRPRYDAETLAYHEAIPGHHLQIAIAQELTDLPAFRRQLGPTAYAEGWALYAEVVADELGLLSTDLDRIGRVSSQAWRAARLVVDTGLHAFGWTRDRAIDYLRLHTALAGNNVVNEIDRYIVWPGQALAYMTGQREILRLRASAMTALGDRFDLAAFHDAVLGSGAVSLGMLRDIVAGHVAARREGPVAG